MNATANAAGLLDVVIGIVVVTAILFRAWLGRSGEPSLVGRAMPPKVHAGVATTSLATCRLAPAVDRRFLRRRPEASMSDRCDR